MKRFLLLSYLLTTTFALNAQSWTELASGFPNANRGISDFSVVDGNTVWALAYDGSGAASVVQEFTKTTDGGTTWTAGAINIGNPALAINDISAVDANTAWLSALVPDDGNGGIYKTTDGGVTWNQQNALAFSTTGQSFLNGVHFFDINNGMAFGDPTAGEFEIYTTSDSGATWTIVPAANIPNPLSGEYGYNGGNVFIGSTCFLVTNRGRILKSSDMGLTWTVNQAPVADFSSTGESASIAFSTALNGCMVKTIGTTYTFYTTTDGAVTWSAGTPFTGSYRVLTYVPGTSTIVSTSAVIAASGSEYSLDNGATWLTIDAGEQRGVAAFYDAATGWCAGFSLDQTTDGVFKFTGTLNTDKFNNTTQFSVYPNPASSTLNISSREFDTYKVSVLDVTGKVMSNNNYSGLENHVDISNLSNGIYFLTVNSGDKTQTIKFIKN